MVSMLVIPVEKLTGDLFDTILAGDQDAASFLKMYFVFFSIWIGTFLMVIIFKWNWPMFNAVKYYSPRVRRVPHMRIHPVISGGTVRPLVSVSEASQKIQGAVYSDIHQFTGIYGLAPG